MEENTLSKEFVLGLFDEKKEKEIVKYIFDELDDKEIIDKLISANKVEGK